MKFLWIFIFALSLTRCGDETPDARALPEGSGQSGEANPALTSFKGPWSGFAYQRQNGTTLQDKGFESAAEFKDDETFVIKIGADIGASGTYQSLDSTKEIYLNVEKSTSSLIGDPGKKVKYSWLRQGKELTLRSTYSEFILARPAGYTETVESTGSAPKEGDMNGKWSCEEPNGGPKWTLEIRDQKEFSLTRYYESSSGMKYSGSIDKDISEKEALMTIKNSDDSSAIDRSYRLSVVGVNELRIGKLAKGDTKPHQVDSSFVCIRK